jgi:prolyl oligopeptidase
MIVRIIREGTLMTHSKTYLAAVATIALASGLAAPSLAHEIGDAVPEVKVAEADVDPYIWLEEARSERSLEWVRAENERTNAALTTDPRFEKLKGDALAILDSEDRVPYVRFSKFGLVNFWQDN